MVRCVIGSVVVAFAIIALVNASAMARDKDKVIQAAAQWDWTVFDEKDRAVETGTFTARGYEILKNGKRIGSFDVVSETQVKVTITEGLLRGNLDLNKDKASAVNWKGEFKSDNGQAYKITVVFVKPK
jgi:hypothetical protein